MIGLDPGPAETGVVVLAADSSLQHAAVMDNQHVLGLLVDVEYQAEPVAIEMIASYGMPVGKDVFETCVWIGRFMQRAYRVRNESLVLRVFRKDVKMHLCGTPHAKDTNVRQAIIDLYPASGGGKRPQIGTKKKPGPLYGVTSHSWAAIGVALTALATEKPCI